MLSKIISYTLLFVVLVLSFAIYLNYECMQKPEREQFMCYKGKLIRSMELNNIYVEVRDTKCEVFEDLIIVNKEVTK